MTVLKTIRYSLVFMLGVCLCLGLAANVSAEDGYKKEFISENAETGYSVIIDDKADLLSDEQEKYLAKDMEPVTAYGNVCFLSLSQNSGTARNAAENAYYEYFKNQSGVLFLIDMDNREIWMSTSGDVYKTVTTSYCTIITDNVYTYASSEDYYGCASNAFSQVNRLLEGQKIAMPMKYISNALLSVIAAVLLNFALVARFTKKWRKSSYGTTEGSAGGVNVSDIIITSTGTRKTYSPVERSGGGGHSGGSHSSGGGHSGGGFSGGGGGHRF